MGIFVIFNSRVFRVIQYREVRWTGHVERIGEMINAHKLLIWQNKWNRPLGKSRPK
jgi:hypothetical protein